MWRLLLITLLVAVGAEDETTDNSRKVLGSSVVTSVSVIMDAGNGSKIYADAVGKPMAKPSTASDLASPIDLLNPDRYEFYTFDDSGDLVKRLMTLEEIQDIIATGISDGFGDTLTSDGFLPEKRVNDVVNNVQNVLKEEIKTHQNQAGKPPLDTPDVSDSWSMILPAVFGNSGEDIKPEPPITHVTPDTIMIEPTIMVSSTTEQISTSEKVMTLLTKKTTPTSTTSTTEKAPMINVEIITNSNSTTEKTVNVLDTESTKVVEIKPPNNFEMTKENPRPSSQVFKSTSKPLRPTRSTVAPSTRLTTPRTTTTARPKTPQTSTSPLITLQPNIKATSRTTTRPTTTTTTKPTTTTTRARSTTTTTRTRPTTTTIRPTTATRARPRPTRTTTTPRFTTTTTTTPRFTTTTTITPRPTTTTATTTTAKPTTTLEPETTTQTVPTTAQVFTTTELPSTTTELFETTTTTEPTTSTSLKSTEIPEMSTLPSSLITFFTVIDNKESTSTTNDDLNTLSTEYVTVKTVTNNTLISTTEPQSTEKSANLLEQYLLTSTNIYEINSELSDASDSTISTTDTTEKVYIRLKNPTEQPTTTTTDQTFIDTIEQLISQAVGTPAPPAATEMEAVKVQEVLMNSANKTGAEMVKEAATIASNMMMDVNDEATTESTTTIIPDLLSDSVSSLLSQVYGQGSTTIEDTTVTTTELPEPVTVESINYVPHIINITIIRNENRKNQSKPAKSDLSLEMDYEDMLKEIQKNSTLASMLPSQEILKGEASSSFVEEKFNETDEATTVMVDLTTTEEITTTEDPATTTITTTTTTKTTSTTSTTTSPSTSTTTESKPSTTTTETKEESNWTLVSTVAPHEDIKFDPITEDSPSHVVSTIVDPPPQIDLVPKPMQGFGLEDSTARLDGDIYQFVQLCNELAFGFWKSVTTGLSSARSVVVSPFAATSLLAMVFLGARGATSGEMNEILKLDDMVTFNPHLIFKNVTESIEVGPNTGVGVSTIVRELFSDRSKGKLLGFYKERVRQFYDGHVEEASFREIGDVIRRRTNLLVKKATDGKVTEFLKDGSIIPKPPLAGISVSIFQGDCSSEGRNGELHFVVLPSLRQRRLIPIPSTIYQTGFLAGYEPSLDATAAAIGTKDHTISTIYIMPGQQGMSTPGDGLARLEKRLVESAFKKGAWGRLLRSLIPRPGLELQIPRFQHRSLVNATQALKKMGLEDLFSPQRADLKGLNGAAHELHLSDVIQVNEFGTCAGEGHREMYPATTERKGRLWEEPGDYLRAFHDPLHDPSFAGLPLALRPRQARLPDSPRLRFDRPFLFLVRHNPSGLILHMGRFHPRLLP